MKPLFNYKIFIFLLIAGLSASPVWAGSPKKDRPPRSGSGNGIHVTVKTVLASQGKPFMDPRLADLTRELKTVFRYSSYRLLAQDNMRLKIGQTGRSSLPGQRILNITPIGIEGNRAKLRLEILKGNRQIFQTVIQLLNHGAITVGGPRHENGVLLFNIGNAF